MWRNKSLSPNTLPKPCIISHALGFWISWGFQITEIDIPKRGNLTMFRESWRRRCRGTPFGPRDWVCGWSTKQAAWGLQTLRSASLPARGSNAAEFLGPPWRNKFDYLFPNTISQRIVNKQKKLYIYIYFNYKKFPHLIPMSRSLVENRTAGFSIWMWPSSFKRTTTWSTWNTEPASPSTKNSHVWLEI